jgi:DNA-binding GntR family transcriptional regulator
LDLTASLQEKGGPMMERQTAHEYVRRVVRRSILNGELSGGTRLVQSELAAMLDVSTTPVREALRDLASEGLVELDPHRGAVVAELDDDELRDIYEIRLLLEPMAMRQAIPKLSDSLIESLRHLHESMVEDPQSVDWIDRNRVFHLAVYETVVSQRLASIIRNLQDASVMHIGAAVANDPSARDRANQEHGEILEALERRDAEAAIEALRHHLRHSLEAVAG